jgi:hypothetical protein
VDSPQLIGEINMSVQMIELEEVTLFEASDDALEVTVTAVRGALSACANNSCGW